MKNNGVVASLFHQNQVHRRTVLYCTKRAIGACNTFILKLRISKLHLAMQNVETTE